MIGNPPVPTATFSPNRSLCAGGGDDEGGSIIISANAQKNPRDREQGHTKKCQGDRPLANNRRLTRRAGLVHCKTRQKSLAPGDVSVFLNFHPMRPRIAILWFASLAPFAAAADLSSPEW